MKTLPPGAVEVTVLDDYRLRVVFDNGETRELGARPMLGRKCYAKLNSKPFFALASVQYGCASWPENTDLDPEWLYDDSIPA